MTATTNQAGAPPAPLEMDPQIRARWVTALRSGKYEQGRQVLRDGAGGLCCLGVLCELAVADGVIPPAEPISGGWAYGECETHLPYPVRQWAGLEWSNPKATDSLTLAELNDGDRVTEREPWTFAQIADLIEGGAS